MIPYETQKKVKKRQRNSPLYRRAIQRCGFEPILSERTRTEELQAENREAEYKYVGKKIYWAYHERLMESM